MLLSLFLAVSFSNQRCLNLVDSRISLTFDTTATTFYVLSMRIISYSLGEVCEEGSGRWEDHELS
jgi:hypothetical protein